MVATDIDTSFVAQCLGAPFQASMITVDLSPATLLEHALLDGEGHLTNTGSLAILTGERTGRSPRDRFIVDRPSVHDAIAWGDINIPLSPESFDLLLTNVREYLSQRNTYVVRALAGAYRYHSRKFLVVAEQACQALFAHQMLVRPDTEELASYGQPDFTVYAAPGYVTSPERDGVPGSAAIAIDFERHIVVVAGTGYSGEIKKSIFSVMNYLLPVQDEVLPMHCSCNVDPISGNTAIFFGLSGTGKTTLSTDPARQLVGDDEHGWHDGGIFNIEGGCYAKCAGLDATREPEIFNAIRFGSMVENVALDSETRTLDFDDLSITENTRAAYPIEHIDNIAPSGTAGTPNVVIFLTADAFGVLPPISRLTPEAAMYQFMMGFTAKIAGTEQGVKEPQPTFSALFGEPFMPLAPERYARMLGQRIASSGARVYLVNTGWTGGPYGTGSRISLNDTRALVNAALDGSIENTDYRHDDRFGVDVPLSCPNVDSGILDPCKTWHDSREYDEAADKLARLFQENFERRYPDASDDLRDAGPRPLS